MTYNIQNDRNGSLKLAFCGIAQAKVCVSLLQDTKITDRVCARNSAVFHVVATDAPSHHRGGVALFYK